MSISGGRHRQGGHTYGAGGVVLDMRGFNQIRGIAPAPLTLTVESGATWDEVQRALAPQGLAVKVMPSSNIFMVGGTLRAVALLVDPFFSTIVCFCVPTLVLLLMVAAGQAARTRGAGWTQIAASFGISVLAAALQQARVAIHPEHFDPNPLYHVLQAVALLGLYRGFRRVPEVPLAPGRV